MTHTRLVSGLPRRDVLVLRSLALQVIRGFFIQRGFVEVDVPLLHAGVPLEATISPFEVCLTTRRGSRRRFLPTSPESGLKRALAEVKRDCFDLGWAFRDGEDEGDWHRACFRMLEWYRLGASWRTLLDDVRALFQAVAGVLQAQREVPVPALPADVFGPWDEITVPEALERHAGVRLAGPQDLPGLVEVVRERQLGTAETWQDALSLLLALEVHPHLGWDRPTFLTAYPTGIAAQARAMDTTPWLAEQFEVFLQGVELANCYGEVTDPDEQRRRFDEEARRAGPRPPVDPAYTAALGRLPARVAGGSVGVDRVLMLLLGVPTIGGVRVEEAADVDGVHGIP